ncbi:MAG TPA: cyanophycinase [Candidatus Sulfotelmatobacter sp.]|nr:cyanophycinase [Candidatus Sulfotelmatobacter sp.]
MQVRNCKSFYRSIGLTLAICILLPSSSRKFAAFADEPAYKYLRIGSERDITTKTSIGYALMGGGTDLDEAFRFLCDKGNGGDFLIVRAAGDDDYNPYVNSLCKTNSVATLIVASREAAADPKVSEIIAHAEAVFIAGGDQARYINWWQNTAMQDALRAHVAAGKPIGGTSAGLAVLGEFIYSAQGDAPDDADLTSAQALANPYFDRVTVRRDFLQIDLLRNILTDTHFAKRNRMGRSLVFLARIVQDGWSDDPREIAVDEKSAVLVEGNGSARVVGPGKGAYFMQVRKKALTCQKETPLSFHDISVYHAAANGTFDLNRWSGSGGVAYSLSVDAGTVTSTQAHGDVY